MFHSTGPLGYLIIAAVVLVLFGRGKVSSLMGEVGKGISAFKKGITEGQADVDKPAETAPPVSAAIDVTPVEQDKA